LIAWFGDLGIINGTWPLIIGKPFSRYDWPVPLFWREPLINPQEIVYIVEYSQTADKHIPISEKKIDKNKVTMNLPEDGLYGAISLANQLDKIISNLESM
jgi:hypothetical protein